MQRKVKVVETSKGSQKNWNRKEDIFLSKGKLGDFGVIDLNPQQEFQTWMGFGGAFTESAAYNLNKVSEDNQRKIITAYFNKESGLGYTLGRTHIHSCDFSLGNYTYIEDRDESLSTFSIEREKKFVTPFIKKAAEEAGESLTILASPWSPPAWMKTNGEMNNGGKLKQEYRQLWANYFVKYIQEMEKEGIPIWGVTVQNEPEATQTWDSCRYSAEEERDFVKNFLGPTFHKSNLEDKKIIVWDHNRDLIVERAKTILSDNEAAKYIWGIGNHWYVSEEFENLSEVHQLFPDKHLLFTEGCIEGGVQLGAWHTGERYARNIIGDMNNWLEGFIDWNLLLDEQGGPNHVGNYCDAPIIVDTENNEVYFNSSYYYIGHFSKFIKPKARRIGLETTIKDLSVTAFKNNTGEIVVVILNETEKDKNAVMQLEGESVEILVTARSISTFIID